MAKIYAMPPSGNKMMTPMNPKRETVDFLLNYSKALSVTNYKAMQFDTLLN